MKKLKGMVVSMWEKIKGFCGGLIEITLHVYSKRNNEHFAIKMSSLFAVLLLSVVGFIHVSGIAFTKAEELYGKIDDMNIVESVANYVFNDNIDEEVLEKRGLEILEVQLEQGDSFWLAQEKLDGYVDKGRYSQFLQLNNLNETDVLQPTAYKFVVSKKWIKEHKES